MNALPHPPQPLVKPLLRGHFHQAAFFLAIGACAVLLGQCLHTIAFAPILVYSLTLISLFGISALYHRVQWRPGLRMWMRRLDHAAIFVLIAGTGTPIFALTFPEGTGMQPLLLVWIAAGFGSLQSLFWVKAPKWVTACLYVGVGWLIVPYLPQLRASLSFSNIFLLFAGGVCYTLGAVIYATKRPNPLPRAFGYHEVFHVLVVIAAAMHFLIIYQLVTTR